MSDPRTLSMMEYEDWRTPLELRMHELWKQFNTGLYALGFKNLYPQQGGQFYSVRDSLPIVPIDKRAILSAWLLSLPSPNQQQ